jgi:hypothetical protein
MEALAPTAIAQSSESALTDFNTMRESLAKTCARSVLLGANHSDSAILSNPLCLLQLALCSAAYAEKVTECQGRKQSGRILSIEETCA